MSAQFKDSQVKSHVQTAYEPHYMNIYRVFVYSKTCLQGPLKNRQNKGLFGKLMKVESIAECSPLEHSAILLTCIKR